MKKILLSFTLFFVIIFPTVADPIKDSEYIVGQTVTRPLFEGALVALRPVLVSAITNDLKKQGIQISDTEAFFDIIIDEFIDEFTEIMQEETGAVYVEMFSESELADLAAFYKTETGQKLIAQTPALMQAGAKMGQIAGQKAGMNSRARVAKRLEEENILIDKDKSITKRLIEFLKR